MKKFSAILLAVLMLLAVIPCSALAKTMTEAEVERAKLALLDTVWESLEAVEAEVLASGAEKTEVVFAVYNAALNNPRVDSASFTDATSKGFFFTVDGMACCYDYVARQASHPEKGEIAKVEVIEGTKNGPVNMNVLLVGPYYGYDSSFTNQYRNEADSIAAVTGGTCTKLEGHAATGPAIAAAAPNNGIIIYDSHGTQSGSSSYLCLTTNEGITSTDYSNGWAVSSGSAAYIDGRYIENHITSPLPNSIFWMAICEGMMASGHGTTGYALLRAGAGCVYGYSQSVTFAGDYLYEATFWNQMKNNGATVAEAFNVMIATHGEPDPYGDAWAIVMSPDDPFPANPDSHQNVNCDWTLFGGNPVDATGLSFAESTYGLAPTFQLALQPIVTPEDANNYSKTWTSSDTSIATVSNKGVVTGVANGTATITYTIASTQYSLSSFSYSASVEVVVSNEYLPEEVMYVPTDTLVPGETYLVGYNLNGRNIVMGNEYNNVNNSRMLKSVNITLGEIAGKTCVTSDVTAAQEWVWGADGMVQNAENGLYLALTGNYLTTAEEGIAWTYAPTENATTGIVSNSANANFKYLGVGSTGNYFNVFLSSYQIQLYRKLVRGNAGVMGDADGDGTVSTADALMVLRYSLGLIQLSADKLALLDINGDGNVDSTDALIILRMATGVAA